MIQEKARRMEQRGNKEVVKRQHTISWQKKKGKILGYIKYQTKQIKIKDMNNEDHYIMKSFTRNTQQFSIFMYSRIYL